MKDSSQIPLDGSLVSKVTSGGGPGVRAVLALREALGAIVKNVLTPLTNKVSKLEYRIGRIEEDLERVRDRIDGDGK
jgi:hypothetical protein